MNESRKISHRKLASKAWQREFAKRYEQARKEADFTYEAVGQHLGVSKSLAHHWAVPLAEITPTVLIQLADFLGVDAGWLLSGRGAARSTQRHLLMEPFEPGQKIFADLVSVQIINDDVKGLKVGDTAVFSQGREPEPGDIVLVVIECKAPLIGRYLAPSPSGFHLRDEGEAELRKVHLVDVVWRGTLTKRTRHGSR